MRLRPATPADAAAIADIYAPYVTASAVSFETEPPTAAQFAERIEASADHYPWLVVGDGGGSLLGYAYASAFRPRPAYRFTVETSVYLRADAAGRGLGRLVYEPLLAILEAQGYAQAIAAVTLPNEASVALHERLGFAPAGVYRQVGWKLGRWHDVGLWQRPLAAPRSPPAEPGPLADALAAAGL